MKINNENKFNDLIIRLSYPLYKVQKINVELSKDFNLSIIDRLLKLPYRELTFNISGNLITYINITQRNNLFISCSIHNSDFIIPLITHSSNDKLVDLYLKGCAIDIESINNLVNLTSLHLWNINTFGVTNTEGDMPANNLKINNFKYLIHLNLENNNLSGTLDLNALVLLETATIISNNINEIKLSECKQLYRLSILDTLLNHLDLLSLSNIRYLCLSGNPLTELEVNHLISLIELDVSGSLLKEIKINNLVNLKTLRISHNKLTTLNISNLYKLGTLNVNNNNLTTIEGLDQLPKKIVISYYDKNNFSAEYIRKL